MGTHRPLAVVVLAIAVGASACSDDDAAAPAAPDDTEADEVDTTEPTLLPLAPDADRVDREAPTFSDPTTIDNPLFPISNLHSTILLGNNEGHPIKIETTLLAEPKVIEVDGRPIETLVSQFLSYEDGRIHELANDWYAQDDNGAVWYLGEDVFNYEDGVVADRHGTWIAGGDGPVAMIMPAEPQPGQVYRPENIPGVLLEEVTVKEVGLTMDGPTGPVAGSMIAQENHTIEGVYEDKYFAPGYGEFFSGVGDSLEQIALAVPTDTRTAPVPAEVVTLYDGALALVAAADEGDWSTAQATLAAMDEAWATHTGGGAVPALLAVQMDRALAALAGDRMVPAVVDENIDGARNAALDVAHASLDLQLQFRPPVEIDRDRFALWAMQLVVDSTRVEASPGFIAGDVATLEWVWERFKQTVPDDAAVDIETQLESLRAAIDDEDVEATAELAPTLVETVAAIR